MIAGRPIEEKRSHHQQYDRNDMFDMPTSLNEAIWLGFCLRPFPQETFLVAESHSWCTSYEYISQVNQDI